MSTLSYGLNITKKPPISARPAPAKRKTIFDDDSGPEDGPDDEGQTAESISTIGGLQASSKPPPSNSKPTVPAIRPSKPPIISQFGDLSAKHTAKKYSKDAQGIDPNIYDYDAVYDSLHAKSASSTSTADIEKKPKYMGNLLAAAEVRKRDQLRAKEKMLAKEREAEGDEFADKEKFVTGAYKRQQEEMRRLEEEEARKEKDAEERKRREGGGMKALYKNLLESDEQKHKEILKAVEEGRGKEGPDRDGDRGSGEKKMKSETEFAKEKGAMVNEDGQVVDKRQLLSAGLNAASAPKPKPKPAPDPKASRGKRPPESARERETRLFEEQLLGKRSASSSDNEDERAAKSRKIEDELLGI